MNIPKSYEALAADLASEKIISKTLLGQKEAYMMLADKGGLDLSESKAREAALREELESRPDVSIKNCIFEGANGDGSQAFEYETVDGVLKKLTKINLDGWLCYGPRGENPLDALQQRLTVAEQRAGEMVSALNVADQYLCAAESLLDRGEDDSLNLEPAIIAVRDALKAALKPAEDPFGVLAETGMTYPEFMRSTFQERHKLTDAECEEFHVWKKNRGKPAEEGEGS